MSQFDHQPSKDRADRLRRALSSSRDEASDQERANKIWNDFRWKIKTLPEATYQAIEALIDSTVVQCEAELKSPTIKAAILDKFSKMRARVSEFTVGESDELPGQ